MKQEYETHEDFFKNVGDTYLHPSFYDINFPITVEEMYQHFKSRMMEELEICVDNLEVE